MATLVRNLHAAMTSPQNHLLAALPTEDFARIEAQLERVPLRLGEMLYEPGEQLQYAYFPTTAIISLHYVMATGASAEAAGVGNEGMLGVALFMGGNTTPSSAVCRMACGSVNSLRPNGPMARPAAR